MSAASMEELYHRNKRIREFMYKFREKDQITVMRDIALLGIELFEAMNQGLVHLRAEDVENTLATIREEGGVRLDKDDRIQPQRLSNGNGVHMGVESAQREYTSMSHHPQVNNYTQLHPHYAHQEVLVNNENFSRAQTVPNTVNYVGEPKMMPVAQNPYELSQSFTGRYPQQRQPIMRSNQEGNIQRLSLYEDSLNGGYFQGSRQGYHYPENLQKNLSETEDLLQKRKMETSRKRLNPKEQNIPAGIPSYISVKPDQDEKHLSKSPTRWELDNSIYEPKQVMIKINRQNTAEIERRNEAIEFGLNYPNWWGDSTEKRKPRPKTRSKTKSSEKHRDSDDSLDDDRYINPQRNTIVHDDKKYEKQKISSFMLGSKDQIRRDSSIRQSASFHHRQSRSPKKDSQGGDTSRSRGGIALHYHMKDLCGNKHDDRPITPAKYEIKEIVTSDRKGKSQDLSAKKKELAASKQKLSQFNRPKKTRKELMERDRKIALKKREKLDKARSKNKNSKIPMSNFGVKNSQISKNVHQRSKTMARKNNVISRSTKKIGKQEASSRLDHRNNIKNDRSEHVKSFVKEHHEKSISHDLDQTTAKYYKQEDVINCIVDKKQDTRDKLKEMLRADDKIAESSVRITSRQSSPPMISTIEFDRSSPESTNPSQQVFERDSVRKSTEKHGIMKHANSIIDRHQERLMKYSKPGNTGGNFNDF